MGSFAFGPGNYGGYNNYAFSGSNTYYTNFNGNSWSTGRLGRVTALGAGWDAYCGYNASTTGHNSYWNQAHNRVASTDSIGGDFTVGCASGTGSYYNNASCADYWQNNESNFVGFYRTPTDSDIMDGANNTNGSYYGQSQNDLSMANYTACFSSTCFGLPTGGTVVSTEIYVRRGGGWNSTYVYVRRGTGWTGPGVYVYVRRSGGWTILNELVPFEEYMRRSGRHVPAGGMPVVVMGEDGWEDAWLVEGAPGWFGSFDPTVVPGLDFTRPGRYRLPAGPIPFTGRYNSFESDELADYRTYAKDMWERALRRGDPEEAALWTTEWDSPWPTVERPAIRPRGNRTPGWSTRTSLRLTPRPSSSPTLPVLSAPSASWSARAALATSARTQGSPSTAPSSTRPRTWSLGARSADSTSRSAGCGCPNLYEWEREAMRSMPSDRLPAPKRAHATVG